MFDVAVDVTVPVAAVVAVPLSRLVFCVVAGVVAPAFQLLLLLSMLLMTPSLPPDPPIPDPQSPPQLVCMYGYSLGVFLPAVLVCVLPIPYISLVALGTAGALSVVFLLRALTPVLLARNAAMAVPVMAGLG